MSNLRNRLRHPAPLYGTLCEIPSPTALEIASLAGWDFLILDAEHAPLTPSDFPGLLRAALGVPVIVRVSRTDAAEIQQALDSGAAGIQAPIVESAESARELVARARFAPHGRRGVNPFVRAARYGAWPDFLRSDETVVVAQIETAAGVEAVEQIARVSGLDALFAGPYDLSQSLGIPGQVDHPLVLSAIARIFAAARGAGLASGVFALNAETGRQWVARGANYVCCGLDTAMLLTAMRAVRTSLEATARDE